MSKHTHTPGPWSGIRETKLGTELCRRRDDGATLEPVAIALDFNRYDRDEEREANARLIAAAPEMLELLRRACEDWDWTPYFRNQVRALIAKVEGDR